MKKDTLVTGLILIASLSLSILFYLGMFTPMDKSWALAFKKGLKCEKEGNLKGALPFYESITRTFEDEIVWAHDYRARCHFLLGNTERAIAEYDKVYELALGTRMESQWESSSDPAFLSFRLQKEGKFQESLPLCEEMVAKSERLSNTYSPGALHQVRDSYYAHCSEGYIRKYYALTKLNLLSDAEALKKRYMAQYKKDVIENYWKAVDKVK